MHRLLQAVVRDRMTDDEIAAARHQVHLVLAASRPRGDVDDPDTWPRLRMLWPHLEVSEALACPDESVRQLLIDRVRYLWQRGGLDQADAFSQEVDDTWSARLRRHARRGRGSRRCAGSCCTCGSTGRTSCAAWAGSTRPGTWTRRCWPSSAGCWARCTRTRLMTAGGLGGDLRALGRYAEALERDRSTYAAWLQVFGEDHPRTLSAANNLAVSYRLVGDYRSARAGTTRCTSGGDWCSAPPTRTPSSPAMRLGRDLREAGEYERSAALLRTVYDTLLRGARAG